LYIFGGFILQTTKNLSDNSATVRAALINTTANIIVTLVAMIMIPITTQILDTADLGNAVSFFSIRNIGLNLFTLASYTAVNRGLIEFPEKKYEFLSSLLLFNMGLITVFGFIYFLFHSFFEHFLGFSPIQKEPIRIRNVMYYTPGSGFTLVFNEQLRKKMVVDCKPGNEMHDKWMIRGAICFGKIVYDSRSTAKHIRYADSVTAEDAGNTNLLIHFIKDELLADTAVEAKEYLKYFYDAFSNEMKPYDKKTMEIFIDDSNNLKSWLRKIFYPHRLRTRISGEIALRILFMIGKI
jgi:hypothetical protein